MIYPSTSSLPLALRRVSVAAGAVVWALGLLVMVGWALHEQPLLSALPGYFSMQVNTALTFCLAGASLVLFSVAASSRVRRVAQVCALLVVLVGGLTASEYVFSHSLGIDELICRDSTAAVGTPAPGRMSPLAALDFVLFGSALLLLLPGRRRHDRFAQLLVLPAATLALLCALWRVYGGRLLNAFGMGIQMGLATSVSLFLLCIGLLLARPERGFMAEISSEYLGGTMARRLLPVAVCLPFALGWLRLQGERIGFYGFSVGLSLMVLSSMVLVAITVWWNARRLNEIDSKRRQALSAVELHASRLEQHNRELQDFAYVASHDLQEPLRKIQGFGDLLKTRTGLRLDPQGSFYLERMENAAVRLQILINDLLVFSRVTTRGQEFALVDLSQVAREVLVDLELRIQQTGATIELGSLPTIQADPTQMRQLLQNLIGNALKFSRPGVPPVVTVEARLLTDTRMPGGPETSLRGFCHLSVQDNGIGFDEKYLHHLFVPFRRLHSRSEYEGTGIGLAICRKIVERHGGTIAASSTPGQGARFMATLPITHDTGEWSNDTGQPHLDSLRG